MENELRIGMQFLEVKTGIVWKLTDMNMNFIQEGFYITDVSLWFQAVYVNTDEDDVWKSTSSMMPKTMFERRLKKGEWKQINNRKNNYY